MSKFKKWGVFALLFIAQFMILCGISYIRGRGNTAVMVCGLSTIAAVSLVVVINKDESANSIPKKEPEHKPVLARFSSGSSNNRTVQVAPYKEPVEEQKPAGAQKQSVAPKQQERKAEPKIPAEATATKKYPALIMPGQVKVTFENIAGYESTKENMEFIVKCLKDRAALNVVGAEIPKGVILYGPPGTGKTLMAKAIAGSAGVPFFSVNASSFINKYVGTGPAAVRELYAQARMHAPSVVFIDEIDAIGGRRGDDTNSEFRNTINALLSELDGMEKASGIITVAATNSLESLDEALVRPGRFDRKIYVPLPGEKDRTAILSLHAKNKPLSGITPEEMARETDGYSGAALATLLNESAIIAAQSGKKAISKEDWEKALYQMATSSEESGILPDSIAKIASYHEAGHALVMKLLCGKAVPRVSIGLSTSGDLGGTLSSSSEIFSTRLGLEHDIMAVYAGRAAEELYFGNNKDITTGSSHDIKEATRMIKDYLNTFGASDDAPFSMSELTGKSTAAELLRDASEMAKRLYGDTLSYLDENRELLDALAQTLYEKRSITDAEIEEILHAGF